MAETKLTTVVDVHRLSPVEWQRINGHLYVGRYQVIRSGRYAGQIWRPQGWGNHYRPKWDDHPTKEAALRACLEEYEQDLAARVKAKGREMIQALLMLAGNELGCWCCCYDGVSIPRPPCHAAVLADWVNRMQAGERPWETFA